MIYLLPPLPPCLLLPSNTNSGSWSKMFTLLVLGIAFVELERIIHVYFGFLFLLGAGEGCLTMCASPSMPGGLGVIPAVMGSISSSGGWTAVSHMEGRPLTYIYSGFICKFVSPPVTWLDQLTTWARDTEVFLDSIPQPFHCCWSQFK